MCQGRRCPPLETSRQGERRSPLGTSFANRSATRPYWKPRAKGLHPSGHLHIFLENGTQTVKMQFGTISQKIQNRCNLHPCEDEKYSGFLMLIRLPLNTFPNVLNQNHAESKSQYRCTKHIQPDTIQSKVPERTKHNNREHKCYAH